MDDSISYGFTAPSRFLTASTVCLSTGPIYPTHSSNQLDTTYDLNEEPDPEFAKLLGSLTMKWNQLEYLIRYCIHRMQRDGLSLPDAQTHVAKILSESLGHTKLIERLETGLIHSQLEEPVKILVTELIQKIGKQKNVEDSLYNRRCYFEHSFYGKTLSGIIHYFRLGGGKEPEILTNKQVEEEKQAILDLIIEIKQTIQTLNELIPSTL